MTTSRPRLGPRVDDNLAFFALLPQRPFETFSRLVANFALLGPASLCLE